MSDGEILWYLVDEQNKTLGPFAENQVLEQCRDGRLSGTMLCWREGMNGWERLQAVQPFCSVFPTLPVSDAEAKPNAFQFDSIGKVFTKAASSVKNTAKVVRLKMSLNKHEKLKSEILYELGKLLYDRNCSVLLELPYAEKVRLIKAEEEAIQQLRQQINDIEKSGQPQNENVINPGSG